MRLLCYAQTSLFEVLRGEPQNVPNAVGNTSRVLGCFPCLEKGLVLVELFAPVARDAPHGTDEVPDEAHVLVPPSLLRVEGVPDRLPEEVIMVAALGLTAEPAYPVTGELLQADEVGLAQGVQGRPHLIRGRRTLLRHPSRSLLQPRLLLCLPDPVVRLTYICPAPEPPGQFR